MVVEKINKKLQIYEENSISLFERYSASFLVYAFGFVFLYYGLQKFIPGSTPVREPVSSFIAYFGINISLGSKLIGLYEILMGLAFFSRRYRTVFWMFLVHQSVTLASLAFIPEIAFKNPWIYFLGITLPYGMDWYAAYVLKNLVFIGGFMMLIAHEKNRFLG